MGDFFRPFNEDDVCLLVCNAEEVTETWGIKKIKEKENINLWLPSTAENLPFLSMVFI